MQQRKLGSINDTHKHQIPSYAMQMIRSCTSVPTINCWHKTIQQPFNHKTAHWPKITNWFDCILAATCCNRRISRHKPLRSSTYWEPLAVWWGRWLAVSIVSRTTVEPICSPVFPDSNSTCVCTGHSFTDNFPFILLLYSCCINLFVVDTCLFHSRMWLKQAKKKKQQKHFYLCVVWRNQCNITHWVPI